MPGKGYGVLSKVSKENWGGGGGSHTREEGFIREVLETNTIMD